MMTSHIRTLLRVGCCVANGSVALLVSHGALDFLHRLRQLEDSLRQSQYALEKAVEMQQVRTLVGELVII